MSAPRIYHYKWCDTVTVPCCEAHPGRQACGWRHCKAGPVWEVWSVYPSAPPSLDDEMTGVPA